MSWKLLVEHEPEELHYFLFINVPSNLVSIISFFVCILQALHENRKWNETPAPFSYFLIFYDIS